MTSHEVTCIKKTDCLNIYAKIESIGGTNPDGGAWRLSQQKAIKAIEEEKYEFYVTKAGRIVKLIIGISSFKHKYLKTENDDTKMDNLLNLPNCK